MKFFVIGIDDNKTQHFNPEITTVISSHAIFSGGERHHQIVKRFLPEGYLWIDIKVPLIITHNPNLTLKNMLDKYYNYPLIDIGHHESETLGFKGLYEKLASVLNVKIIYYESENFHINY